MLRAVGGRERSHLEVPMKRSDYTRKQFLVLGLGAVGSALISAACADSEMNSDGGSSGTAGSGGPAGSGWPCW